VNPWWTWLPPIVAAAGWPAVAWRLNVSRRRRRAAAAISPLITDGLEAHVAVGSLSGIAPGDITNHALLVLTGDGGLAVSGTGCDSLRALMIAHANMAIAVKAFEAHDHSHGSGS
jgi:hypothetical protein